MYLLVGNQTIHMNFFELMIEEFLSQQQKKKILGNFVPIKPFHLKYMIGFPPSKKARDRLPVPAAED